MAFTLWNLFEATLLCLNAVCILHEERFLVKSKHFIIFCLRVFKKASLKRRYVHGIHCLSNLTYLIHVIPC
jgi:hypothetical protein